jgi:hypothetical protein
MARWANGEQTVQFLVDRDRLESFEAEDLATVADALIGRATLRAETTGATALADGGVDGAYVAAFDANRLQHRRPQYIVAVAAGMGAGR